MKIWIYQVHVAGIGLRYEWDIKDEFGYGFVESKRRFGCAVDAEKDALLAIRKLQKADPTKIPVGRAWLKGGHHVERD